LEIPEESWNLLVLVAQSLSDNHSQYAQRTRTYCQVAQILYQYDQESGEQRSNAEAQAVAER
jgi:hypothetical protein